MIRDERSENKEMKGGGKLALVRDEIEVGRVDLGQVPEDLGLAVALLDRLPEMIIMSNRL